MTDKQNAEYFIKFIDSGGWGLPPETTMGAIEFLKAQGDAIFIKLIHAAEGIIDTPEPEEVVEELDDTEAPGSNDGESS